MIVGGQPSNLPVPLAPSTGQLVLSATLTDDLLSWILLAHDSPIIIYSIMDTVLKQSLLNKRELNMKKKCFQL